MIKWNRLLGMMVKKLSLKNDGKKTSLKNNEEKIVP